MSGTDKTLTAKAFTFAPFSDKQAKLLTWWQSGCPAKEKSGVIADGSIRSGKSLCLSLSFSMWAMATFDGQCFALCGKTLGSLRRNVLISLKQMLIGRGFVIKERRSENCMLISDGNVCNTFYFFGGKDEGSADLIQGITLAGVLFDEVALMPKTFVNQATARCSVKGSKWWFNCNPESPHHWFYTDWIMQKDDKNLLYIHFTMDDNPSLDSEVKRRYEKNYTGVFYDRFIRGLWVVAQGLVYQMVANEPQNYIANSTLGLNGRYFISIDYGTRNPFSMGLWCVSGKTAVRVKEWYYDSKKAMRQLTDEEYYEKLCDFAQGYLITSIIIDPSAASFIQTIRKYLKYTVRKADNNVLYGIRVTSTLLQCARVKIGKDCKHTLREFSLYRWDDKGGGKDEVVKQDDHAMDEIRYFCTTVLAREFKWTDREMKNYV